MRRMRRCFIRHEEGDGGLGAVGQDDGFAGELTGFIRNTNKKRITRSRKMNRSGAGPHGNTFRLTKIV